ncbi:MAG: MFS transporter [Clostridia bacterium]|nr:MFS transporter [Clostridia bacterium]
MKGGRNSRVKSAVTVFMDYISKKERNNFMTGLAGQNLVYCMVGASFFTYFMTDIAMFPPAVVTVLLLLMKIWDGINDPIIGAIVDRHRFKSGEKLRPLLRYTPVPVGVFTILLFIVFSTAESLLWLRVSYFVIMYLCWDITYTLQDVAIWGMTSVVSPDSNERDKFVQWARTIGSIFYGVFSALIPMVMESVALASGNSLALMTFVFAAIFGLGGALISAKCYKAQERVRIVRIEQQQTSMIECFKLLLQNKMLMLLTLASIFGSLAFGNNLITYFFKYMLPDGQFGGFIGALGITTIYSALTYAPSFIGMIFATKLRDICGGYRNLIIVVQVCTIIGRVAAFLIGFEGKNMLIGIAIMAILNIPSGAVSIAQTSLFCDSVDYMEWKTGKRTEGVTFAMQTFFTKVSSGITGGLATMSLSLIGYQAVADVPGAVYYGTQSATFESWIWPLVMLTPAIAALLYIIPLLFIKYSPEQKAQVEKELAQRRALKETAETE